MPVHPEVMGVIVNISSAVADCLHEGNASNSRTLNKQLGQQIVLPSKLLLFFVIGMVLQKACTVIINNKGMQWLIHQTVSLTLRGNEAYQFFLVWWEIFTHAKQPVCCFSLMFGLVLWLIKTTLQITRVKKHTKIAKTLQNSVDVCFSKLQTIPVARWSSSSSSTSLLQLAGLPMLLSQTANLEPAQLYRPMCV